MIASITGTDGVVAIAAGALALVALVWAISLTVRMSSLRRAQRVLLGESSQQDLTAHAAQLQETFSSLHQYVYENVAAVQKRMDAVEQALREVIAHRALVRYDAYNEQSGKQSLSIALLDATRSGVVITCIHHRDQARVYAKQINRGEAELELSPEEDEAVRTALAAPLPAAAQTRG